MAALRRTAMLCSTMCSCVISRRLRVRSSVRLIAVGVSYWQRCAKRRCWVPLCGLGRSPVVCGYARRFGFLATKGVSLWQLRARRRHGCVAFCAVWRFPVVSACVHRFGLYRKYAKGVSVWVDCVLRLCYVPWCAGGSLPVECDGERRFGL